MSKHGWGDSGTQAERGVQQSDNEHAREAFLDRIAHRLGRGRIRERPTEAPSTPWTVVLPTAPQSELLQRFLRELAALGATGHVASSKGELHDMLRAELSRWGARRLVAWAEPELRSFDLSWLWTQFACASFGEPAVGGSSETTFRVQAMAADVGITGVDFALATTGTLVLSAAPGRPRSVSLLPPVHIALVHESQIVARMGDALSAYRGERAAPSAVHFISGPSRTSDIENDLSIGVHGPAAVCVLVLRRPAPANVSSSVERPGVA